MGLLFAKANNNLCLYQMRTGLVRIFYDKDK